METIKRVRYNKNPLVQVIYQLRFPTILSISSNQESRASFQETIRNVYPNLDETIERQNEILIMPDGRTDKVTKNETKNFSFISEDGAWKINLTNSFISLSTTSYLQWEDFFARVIEMTQNFDHIYHPSFYSRVGLRYIDGITRSNLGLEGCPWTELLEPHILGCIENEEKLKKYNMDAEYEINHPNTFVRMHFALGQINNSKENSFILDCDYFQQGRIGATEYVDVSNKLHDESVRVFHNAITAKLHESMEPEEI